MELWDASHAILGVISIVSVQRAIQKILISVFLSREYKHDETNRAWWSGKWYGRGLGSSALSQPAREFVVKIVEMSLWSSDFLMGHILLIVLTPPTLNPFVDKLHSTMMCTSWLRCYGTPTDVLISLVAPVKADPTSSLLHEAEATASLDCESSALMHPTWH